MRRLSKKSKILTAQHLQVILTKVTFQLVPKVIYYQNHNVQHKLNTKQKRHHSQLIRYRKDSKQ